MVEHLKHEKNGLYMREEDILGRLLLEVQNGELQFLRFAEITEELLNEKRVREKLKSELGAQIGLLENDVDKLKGKIQEQ